MTPEPRDEPEISPADERRVSDLLGSLRGDAPRAPADVSARLDETLKGLSAERSERPGGPVSHLAERRNRRWPKVLVAAAAVSVVGLGVGNILADGGMEMATDSAESGAAGSAPEPHAAREGGGADEQGEADPSEDTQAEGFVSGERLAAGSPRRLRSDSFGPDAQRFADVALVEGAAVFGQRDPSAARAGCEVPDTGQGDDPFDVRLDGKPATIVFQPEEDGVRRADVYLCDDASTPVATTFVSIG